MDAQSEAVTESPASGTESPAGEVESPTSGGEKVRPPEPLVAPARRFLGGKRSAAEGASAFPLWFRLFALSAAVCSAGLALVTTMTWPIAESRGEPTVHCLAVMKYAAPAMPPVSFIENDARLVLNAAECLMQSRST